MLCCWNKATPCPWTFKEVDIITSVFLKGGINPPNLIYNVPVNMDKTHTRRNPLNSPMQSV